MSFKYIPVTAAPDSAVYVGTEPLASTFDFITFIIYFSPLLYYIYLDK